ncbi:hypothetical protein [Luteolibacter marinus]|uniref:hypothetical protein n=1 Tax=Luteolibacter marinus TaxID=2776705 RepID=UPI00186725B8|nr:hypothetical protein [Luteolibacter marinus]
MAHSLSIADPSDRLPAGGDTAVAAGEVALRMQCFAEFWQGARPSVRAYLASFVPDGGILDDCVQEVALVAWKKGPLDKGSHDFLHHALACARHIGMAARRKIRADRLNLLAPDVAGSLADSVATLDPVAGPSDRVLALRQCIGRLSADQQALIRRRYGDEGSAALAEEARRSGKSIDTLYKRLERLRGLLRDCVTRQLNHPE